jgi:hypothetical protein
VAKKKQMHHSALEMLWKCGEMFNQRYVLGRKMAPSIVQQVGKGVDAAVNENLQHKIDEGSLLPVEQVTEVARDTVIHAISEDGDLLLTPDETQIGKKRAVANAVDKAVRLSKAHALDLAPSLKPKHVQRSWTVEIDGFDYDLAGTIDLDETDDAIRDLKTSGKTPTKNAAHLSDQLTMYAMAKYALDGVIAPKVTLDTIVDLKKATKIDIKESKRTKDDFKVLLERIANAAQVIEAGAFTPARQSDWWCSYRFCGYAPTCPYFRKPVSVFIEGDDNE